MNVVVPCQYTSTKDEQKRHVFTDPLKANAGDAPKYAE
jgi:hypothetical protein